MQERHLLCFDNQREFMADFCEMKINLSAKRRKKKNVSHLVLNKLALLV